MVEIKHGCDRTKEMALHQDLKMEGKKHLKKKIEVKDKNIYAIKYLFHFCMWFSPTISFTKRKNLALLLLLLSIPLWNGSLLKFKSLSSTIVYFPG